MISSTYCTFLYIMSILIFFMSSQSMIFWISMEINLIVFILLIFYTDLKKKLFQEDLVFLYFVIQSLGSFLFLFSIYFKEEFDLFCDLTFVTSISLKLGIFPFYFWILNLGGSLGSIMFILILSLQKVPMFLIFLNLESSISMFFLFFSFVFGSTYLYFCDSLMKLLLFSSISSSFWVYLMFMQDLMLYLLFFGLYFLSLMFLSSNSGWDKEKIWNLSFFMFIGGLPPFSLFFFKFLMSSLMNFKISMLVFLMFWVFSWVSLLGYMKFFHYNFFLSNLMYLKKKFCFSKSSFMVGCVLFSFPYVV